MESRKLIMLGGLSLTLVATIAMVFWTWDKCPDPLIDFGREIYFPWRISQGEHLYRDLQYFNGPLTPYTHALVMKVFGASIDTLKGFNAAVVIACALLVWHLVRQMGNDWSAALAGVMFAVMFGCEQVRDSTFNFLTAYSYDLPHGAVLSLGMLACLQQSTIATNKVRWIAGAGLLLGLVALTKAEVILGSAASAAVFLLLDRASLTRRDVLIFASAFVGPILVALLLLCIAMPPGTAVSGLLGSWKFLGHTELFDLKYFQWLRGTDDVGGNLLLVLVWLVVWGAVAGVAFLAGRLVRDFDPLTEGVIAGLLGLFLLVPPVVLWLHIPWPGALRPLPVIVLGALVILVLRRKRATDATTRRSLLLPIAFAVFSGLLLLKIVLNVHQFHYGFVLAMPAAMLMVVMLVSWLPQYVAQKGGSRWVATAGTAAALLAVVLVHVRMNNAYMQARRFQVSSGANAFFAGGYGPVVDNLARAIVEKTPPGSTLVCFPEGLLTNFLSNRLNPTGHAQFTPPALAMFGEARMLADLQRTSPDYIVIFEWDNSIYGPKYFGLDYGQSIATWIASGYQKQGQVGDAPYSTGKPGAILMKRKPATQPVAR